MSYEAANEWFKKLHVNHHKTVGRPMTGVDCLNLNCGHIWHYVINTYQSMK